MEAKRAASPGLLSSTGYSARTCGLGQALWLLRPRPRGHLTADLHPASTWPPHLAPGISEAAGKAPWAGFRTKINHAVRQRLAEREAPPREGPQGRAFTAHVSADPVHSLKSGQWLYRGGGEGERQTDSGAAGTQRQHMPGPAWSLRVPARGLTGPQSPTVPLFH